jgi:hypothetical protein
VLRTHLTKHRVIPVLLDKIGGGGEGDVGRLYDVTLVIDLHTQSIRILEPELIGPIYRYF